MGSAILRQASGPLCLSTFLKTPLTTALLATKEPKKARNWRDTPLYSAQLIIGRPETPDRSFGISPCCFSTDSSARSMCSFRPAM